ncbi:MAG: CRISPR-associated endonuclease Cas2 [Verrucomicrobiales bacterium]|nr:CRISPR-associated endonuclease Cas2 [Verrucomicrobiales bacterium]
MPKEKLSPYRMGWMLVMFDLPVLTKAQRRAATDFRKALLDDGFFMVQFSIYTRACPDLDRMEKHASRIQKIIPRAGNVRALFLTDAQWTRGICISGGNYRKKHPPDRLEQPEQVEFW